MKMERKMGICRAKLDKSRCEVIDVRCEKETFYHKESQFSNLKPDTSNLSRNSATNSQF